VRFALLRLAGHDQSSGLLSCGVSGERLEAMLSAVSFGEDSAGDEISSRRVPSAGRARFGESSEQSLGRAWSDRSELRSVGSSIRGVHLARSCAARS